MKAYLLRLYPFLSINYDEKWSVQWRSTGTNLKLWRTDSLAHFLAKLRHLKKSNKTRRADIEKFQMSCYGIAMRRKCRLTPLVTVIGKSAKILGNERGHLWGRDRRYLVAIGLIESIGRLLSDSGYNIHTILKHNIDRHLANAVYIPLVDSSCLDWSWPWTRLSKLHCNFH